VPLLQEQEPEYLASNPNSNSLLSRRLDCLAPPRPEPPARACLVNSSSPSRRQGVSASILPYLTASHYSQSSVLPNPNSHSNNRPAVCSEGRPRDCSEPDSRTNPLSRTHWLAVFLAKNPPRKALGSSDLPPPLQPPPRREHCSGVAPWDNRKTNRPPGLEGTCLESPR